MRKLVIIVGVTIMVKSIFLSAATVTMYEIQRDKAIAKYSIELSLEPALIKAFMTNESGDFARAERCDYLVLKDQKWVKDYIAQNNFDATNMAIYSSLGYMQVLYLTAHWLGYRGTPEGLLVIDENVKWGCKYIRYLIDKKGCINIKDVISSYNQGGPYFKDLNGNKIHDENEPYNNNSYVVSVYNSYKQYGGSQ